MYAMKMTVLYFGILLILMTSEIGLARKHHHKRDHHHAKNRGLITDYHRRMHRKHQSQLIGRDRDNMLNGFDENRNRVADKSGGMIEQNGYLRHHQRGEFDNHSVMRFNDDVPKKAYSINSTVLEKSAPPTKSFEVEAKRLLNNNRKQAQQNSTTAAPLTKMVTTSKPNNSIPCKTNKDCQLGSCCQIRNGKEIVCVEMDVPDGKQCWNSCMCAKGLVCYYKGGGISQHTKDETGICKKDSKQ